MNPLKCAFGVMSGKFLDFVVRHRGIEIDESKIKTIQDMHPPTNLKGLHSLQRSIGLHSAVHFKLGKEMSPIQSFYEERYTFRMG